MNVDTAQSASFELRHVPYLDGWRGLAILLVLGGHFFNLPAARTGVEIFFVLSGLLMSQVLFQKRTPLATFYRRRIARVFPVYYLYLAVVALVAAFAFEEFPAGQLFFNAIFLRSYVPDGILLHELAISHLWSLNVEEHSYIVLSLVALFVRNTKVVRLILTAAAVGCIVAYRVQGAGGAIRTECAAFPLLASAALSLWLSDAPGKVRRSILVVSLVALPLCVVASRALHGSVMIDLIAKPLALAFMVNVLDAAPPMVHRMLSAPWLRWFGICSFSIYVWQGPFEVWVRWGWVDPFIGLGAAVVIGAASFYFIESPLRRLIRGGNAASVGRTAKEVATT